MPDPTRPTHRSRRTCPRCRTRKTSRGRDVDTAQAALLVADALDQLELARSEGPYPLHLRDVTVSDSGQLTIECTGSASRRGMSEAVVELSDVSRRTVAVRPWPTGCTNRSPKQPIWMGWSTGFVRRSHPTWTRPGEQETLPACRARRGDHGTAASGQSGGGGADGRTGLAVCGGRDPRSHRQAGSRRSGIRGIAKGDGRRGGRERSA